MATAAPARPSNPRPGSATMVAWRRPSAEPRIGRALEQRQHPIEEERRADGQQHGNLLDKRMGGSRDRYLTGSTREFFSFFDTVKPRPASST